MAETVPSTKEASIVNDSHDQYHTDEHLPQKNPLHLRKVYRKLDLRIIPPFWILYFLCSAVRSLPGLTITMNTSNGHDLGTHLNLTSHQISTGLALFYVAYVVFEVPSNLAMSKLSPSVWLARITISVGIIGIGMVGMRNAAGYYVLRFLLGAVEAGLWPGMTLFLTLFYPPHRMGKRIGWYFTASQVSAAVVGLVSAGFQQMDGAEGLVGFQWMFLIWGLVTLVVGFMLIWWLPDRPLAPGEARKISWYSKFLPIPIPALRGDDALLHYHDLSEAYHNSKWALTDLWKVLIDWRFWPCTIMYFGKLRCCGMLAARSKTNPPNQASLVSATVCSRMGQSSSGPSIHRSLALNSACCTLQSGSAI